MGPEDLRPDWNIYMLNGDPCDCDTCFNNKLPKWAGEYALAEVCECKECECI